jgi:hypothetical protein
MAVRPDPSFDTVPSPVQRPGGLASYLARHLEAERPFGIVTAADGPRAATAVGAALPALAGRRTIWLPSPLPTGRALLVALLAELGLAPPPSGLDDLHHLLLVYLQHQVRRGRHSIAILATADRCGPCVFDLLQTLARVPGTKPGSAAISFLLCGGPDLHRVVDSAGMASARSLLRERYDLERARPWLARSPLLVAPRAPAGRAGPAGEPTLTVLLDGQVRQRLVLAEGSTAIGRDASNRICIPSRYVSARHAVITRQNGIDQLFDLHSRNGTAVNGRAIREHRLRDGDVIAIGNFRIRYRND